MPIDTASLSYNDPRMLLMQLTEKVMKGELVIEDLCINMEAARAVTAYSINGQFAVVPVETPRVRFQATVVEPTGSPPPTSSVRVDIPKAVRELIFDD